MKYNEPEDGLSPGERVAANVFAANRNPPFFTREELATLIDDEFKQAFQWELVTGHASSPFHLMRSLREAQQYFQYMADSNEPSPHHRETAKGMVHNLDLTIQGIAKSLTKDSPPSS